MLVILTTVLLGTVVAQDVLAESDVSNAEQGAWLRWVIPLPKEIKIPAKLAVPASEVKISLRPEAGEVEKQAAEELIALLKKRGWSESGEKTFEILVGVCDSEGKLMGHPVPGAGDLSKLPNNGQAYVIRPLDDRRLALTALNEPGVYYAAKTLQQLLEGRLKDKTAMIPLAVVTDWPDLAQRGQNWGSINYPFFSIRREIEWMSRHKLNHIEAEWLPKMHPDGHVTWTDYGTTSNDVVFARCRALNVVPSLWHLSVAMMYSHVYDVYPELQAKGKAGGYAPCPTHPKLPEVLAQYMIPFARMGATDINAWLTEGQNIYCSCERCDPETHFAMETRALVKAWQIVRKRYPGLKLWIMLTQGSAPTNDKVLDEVPADVGIVYYNSGYTYTAKQEPLIPPLLEEFAARGGRLGVYPIVSTECGIMLPWSCPQYVKYRMREFAQKKLTGFTAYGIQDSRFYDFNLKAAAEWSWNAGGRTEREFTEAWATREGIRFKSADSPVSVAAQSPADAVADWVELLGPVGWNIHGARIAVKRFSREHHPDHPANMIATRARPVLGRGLFKYFPSEQHMNDNLAKCEKAMSGMLTAIRTVLDENGSPPTDLFFVSTCDEEGGGSGAYKLMEEGFRVNGAVVGEPTDLNIVSAHKGVIRWNITTHGLAAHTSTPSRGVNAISMMQKVIERIEGPVAAELHARHHPVLNEPTITVSTIQGGSQVNIVPATCTIGIDRRMLPSESGAGATEEVLKEMEDLKACIESFDYVIDESERYPALEEDVGSPIARCVAAACEKVMKKSDFTFAPWAANSGIFKQGGIPCVVFGPGSARQAHTIDEYVEIEQVVKAAEIYAHIIRAW